MAEIVKLWAKQAVNSALHYRNGLDTTLVYDLPLNSEVLIWRKSGNQTGPYCLLAIEIKYAVYNFLTDLLGLEARL